ncbi:MAG: radical SAM/SPASM domain-containing protein [archaeon]
MVEKFNVSWIVLTYKCNNNCKWCYASSNGSRNEELEKDRVPGVLDLLKEIGIKRTILIGGEPTIYKNLEYVLDEHNKRGIETGFVTNGRMLHKKSFSKLLGKKGLKDITVSIEGYDAKSHDSITNSNGSYDQAIKGIKNASSEGIRVSTNTVISDSNKEELEKIVDSILVMPVEKIGFNICGPCLTSEDKRMNVINPYEAAKSFERVYKKYSEKIKMRLVTPVPLCFFEEDTRENFKSKQISSGGPCQLSHGRNFVVDCNGDINPCTHLSGFPLGNIFDNGKVISKEEFLKNYNSEEGIAYKLRQKMSRNASTKCNEENCKEPCSGGCPLFWAVYNPQKEIKGTKA